MVDALRIILLVALAAAALTTAGLTLAWWMEPRRRLHRALDKTLGGSPEVEAVSPAEGAPAPWISTAHRRPCCGIGAPTAWSMTSTRSTAPR
ncbi:hypothetical protein [Brevundimonas abyssalis]|uniref:hypothetical protein n=1 Tax=Brevundimonas abyssalis TaxID=1125965 RepID=UPI0035A24024